MEHYTNTIDRLAMLVGIGLVLLGTVVLGLLEVIAGEPYGASPIMNDAGEVVATPFVDPNLRTGLVILGLLVLMLWGFYKMTSTAVHLEGPAREVAASE